MKILYVSPEHVSGTLDLWVREHRRRGHECRYVTFYPSPFQYREDICLRLPLHPDKSWILNSRRKLYRLLRGPEGEDQLLQTSPPYRPPTTLVEKMFFSFRDFVISPWIQEAICRYDLDSFDIIHLDQGLGFFRSARVIRRWAFEGKRMVGFYHGSDMRNRGIFPNVDECLNLRLTSELDLLYMDPRLEYLFLPFDTRKWIPQKRKHGATLRIAHSARNAFKGTNHIVDVVRSLEKRYPVELVLIQGVSHARAMEIKARCDIAIDQIADAGGWGYGMSGVEYLSLGIPTCTRINDTYASFIPDHPFVSVTPKTLEAELIRLIEDHGYRKRKGEEGRAWVERTHDIRAVGDALYSYYAREGWV